MKYNKIFTQHPSGLWVAQDGEVYVPKSGKHPAHYTYGYAKKDGYKYVGYKGKEYLVHRLVAECYIPNTEGKPYIDHIIPVSNGGTNEVSNLRWCTHKENCNNSQSKQNYSKARLIPVIGTNLKTGEVVEFAGATEAYRTLGIHQPSISACCKGKKNSAGGYTWRYA